MADMEADRKKSTSTTKFNLVNWAQKISTQTLPVCASSKLCKIVIKRKIVSKKLVKGLQLHSSGRCAHIEAQRDPRELLYALGAWLLQPMVWGNPSLAANEKRVDFCPTTSQSSLFSWGPGFPGTPQMAFMPVTCESLDSRDFFFKFHFSISISIHFYFTFTSRFRFPVIFISLSFLDLDLKSFFSLCTSRRSERYFFFASHFSIVQNPLSRRTLGWTFCDPTSAFTCGFSHVLEIHQHERSWEMVIDGGVILTHWNPVT